MISKHNEYIYVYMYIFTYIYIYIYVSVSYIYIHIYIYIWQRMCQKNIGRTYHPAWPQWFGRF